MKNNLLTLKTRMLALMLLLLAAASAGANDGTYYTSGNQLVPLQETDIRVRKEVLTITLMDNGYARVDVWYDFWNPGTSVKHLLMGFEADPPYNDNYQFYPDGAHPNIHDFVVEMNGRRLDYRHAACVRNMVPLQPIDTTKRYTVYDDNNLFEEGKTPDDGTWGEGISYAYVYSFEADFQPGLNRVHHTYTYRLSVIVGIPWSLDYKLTPAGRWAGGKIDDFTLVVRVDNTAKHFTVLENAFPGASFSVSKGTGKIRHSKRYDTPCHEVSLRNGAITLHVSNFHPEHELSIQAVDVYMFSDQELRPGMSYDRSSPMFYYMHQNNLSDSDFYRRVIRNLPFAHRGYVFKDKRLKKYFESLWWYMPDPDYKDSTDDFTKVDWLYFTGESEE